MKKDILNKLKGGLIVSCQATPDEPHYMKGITTMFAKCAEIGGAVGIRANTPEDIQDIKKEVDLPVIGLWKIDRGIKDVYLTPDLKSAQALYDAGAEVIAVQATDHLRDDGKEAFETIKEIKEHIPKALIFADVRNAEDAKKAIEYGADIVAPTLQSFTSPEALLENHVPEEPNFELLQEILDVAKDTDAKVIMEGKVNTPEQAKKCIEMGCWSVVVGNAITRPHNNTKRFVAGISK